MRNIYLETFDGGPGGWIGWDGSGPRRLEIDAGAAFSRGPWWVDANHAPPGGGYLHLLYCLHTHARWQDNAAVVEAGGDNRFVEGAFPTDFTNARIVLRLRGEVELRGAQFVLLAQAQVGQRYYNHVLSGQPILIAPAWTEQTIDLKPDLGQWTCLGSRHDRMDTYGWGDIADVLRHLDTDIILVFHSLDVAPATPVDGDIHRLRAEVDYEVEPSRLPQGHVLLDEVRIEFNS
jgi:hypothetical protein